MHSRLQNLSKVKNINRNAWLMSFGDLLTLLLCFFLAIISLAPFTHKKQALVSDQIRQNATLQAESGISIAQVNYSSQKVYSELLKIGLKEDDYSEVGTELNQVKLKEILDSLKAITVSDPRVEIESCYAGSRFDGWFISIGRALFVKNHLKSFGFKANNFKVRVLGPNCLGLFLDNAVTRIKIYG